MVGILFGVVVVVLAFVAREALEGLRSDRGATANALRVFEIVDHGMFDF